VVDGLLQRRATRMGDNRGSLTREPSVDPVQTATPEEALALIAHWADTGCTIECSVAAVHAGFRYQFIGPIGAVDEAGVFGLSSDDTRLLLGPELFFEAACIELQTSAHGAMVLFVSDAAVTLRMSEVEIGSGFGPM